MESLSTNKACSFRDQLKKDFSFGIDSLQKGIEVENSLKIDLHCHDKNSDVPDELWGRILGIPETWLKTSTLMEVLQRNGATAYTITNHNNAKSCWKLKEKGVDILVGGEFTCFFKKHNAYIHVLAYGFTPEQETKLNHLRSDIFSFCNYCLVENIPTVLPHPTSPFNVII
jgi:predicted metal-dependent phosphoesterase TrpH